MALTRNCCHKVVPRGDKLQHIYRYKKRGLSVVPPLSPEGWESYAWEIVPLTYDDPDDDEYVYREYDLLSRYPTDEAANLLIKEFFCAQGYIWDDELDKPAVSPSPYLLGRVRHRRIIQI